jgi:fatty acid-binding protein DegV
MAFTGASLHLCLQYTPQTNIISKGATKTNNKGDNKMNTTESKTSEQMSDEEVERLFKRLNKEEQDLVMKLMYEFLRAREK